MASQWANTRMEHFGWWKAWTFQGTAPSTAVTLWALCHHINSKCKIHEGQGQWNHDTLSSTWCPIKWEADKLIFFLSHTASVRSSWRIPVFVSLRCHFRSHCQVNNGTGFFSRKKKSHNYVEEMEEIVTFAFLQTRIWCSFWVRRVKMNTVFFFLSLF